MPDRYVIRFVVGYLALGACVAVVYVVVDWVGAGRGMEHPITARPRQDAKVSSRLYAWFSFFVKVVVMWPWVISTVLRSR